LQIGLVERNLSSRGSTCKMYRKKACQLCNSHEIESCWLPTTWEMYRPVRCPLYSLPKIRRQYSS